MAYRRRQPAARPIGLINLFLGWTVIGWIVAMVRATSVRSPFVWTKPEAGGHNPPARSENQITAPTVHVDRGDSREAARAALALLCTIADVPLDVRVSVRPYPGETADEPGEH